MIGTLISSYLLELIIIYLWNSWSDSKIKYKSIRTFSYSILMLLVVLLNYYTVKNLFKFLSLTILLIFIYMCFFKKKFKESIFPAVMTQFLCLIGESIFATFMFIILKNGVQEFVNNYFGSFITNMVVAVLVLFIGKLPIITKLYHKLNKIMLKIDEITIIFFTIAIIYIYSIFAFNIYYGGNPELLMILSASISLLAFILIFLFIKVKYDYVKINSNYNNSLLSLKELENAITNHRIDNHENRNHLMTIRNMTTSKKVASFIDSILNNDIKDDNRIMKETSSIPSGGLRGLIYSKLLLMYRKGIEYELDVSSSVKVVDMVNFDDFLMLDVCKIIGIFLDNAIEEVDTIDDKYIVIELFIENNDLIICISNSYDNTKNLSNIYKPGVSTKGGNHGYGLSLVKKIVKNNDKLENYVEITENEFTQKLIIKK